MLEDLSSLTNFFPVSQLRSQNDTWQISMLNFCGLNLSLWTWLLVLYEQPYFEVQLLCLAPHPSWLQELQDQPVTCELGLPRHWSYRHGRWRRIDGCQDIMLSYTTINYYFLFKFIGTFLRLLLLPWLLLFLSISYSFSLFFYSISFSVSQYFSISSFFRLSLSTSAFSSSPFSDSL